MQFWRFKQWGGGWVHQEGATVGDHFEIAQNPETAQPSRDGWAVSGSWKCPWAISRSPQILKTRATIRSKWHHSIAWVQFAFHSNCGHLFWHNTRTWRTDNARRHRPRLCAAKNRSQNFHLTHHYGCKRIKHSTFVYYWCLHYKIVQWTYKL